MKNKKTWIIIAIVLIAIVAIFVVMMRKVNIITNQNENGTAISIIGGADGPTSVFLAGKVGKGDAQMTYTSITMEQAAEIFKYDGSYVILDVRRADEFAEGHIPGAINVANEDIHDTEPAELPDKDQLIYVYCRSGRRSKEAAGKLAAMGYKNIVEFGGILDWTGEIEK